MTNLRIEMLKLLQRHKRGNEAPGDTVLRALRQMTPCEHPWAVCDAQGPYCQACGMPWSKVLEQERLQMTPMQLIKAERLRQTERLGWTIEHDDTHTDGSLLAAAVCYYRSAQGEFFKMTEPPPEWPWEKRWWKPKYPQHPECDLERAGALFLAERERRKRAGIAETNEFQTIFDKIIAALTECLESRALVAGATTNMDVEG